MKIEINDPCHEKWEEMTPNKQGAFCGSCQKTVVDFSKIGIGKIKEFFSKPQEGRVCGRFEEKQLIELSFDDFFSRFRYWNFGKKFAVIFFLAFGFWLFPGTAAAQHHKVGLVAEEPPPVKPVQKDTAKTIHMQGQPVIMGKPALERRPEKMGIIKCDKPDTTKTKKKPVKKTSKQKIQKPAPHVMGDIAPIDENIQPVAPKEEKD